MKNRLMGTAAIALVIGILVVAGPLLAHHGNASFDNSKRVTLKGTVTEWVWANPHCWLKLDAKSDNGEVTHWIVEQTNAPGLVNSGWTKNSLKPGDQITITLIPVKNGRPLGRFDCRDCVVTLANGKTLRYFGTGEQRGQE